MGRSVSVNRLSYLVIFGMLLAGCGATSVATGKGTSTIATPPAATALPAFALPWQARPFETNNVAIAPSDGNTMYTCEPGNAQATHDGGAHIIKANVPSTNHGPRCTPVVDSGDAQIAILHITQDGHGPYVDDATNWPHSSPGPGAPVFDLFTLDGGHSWQMVPNGVLVNDATTINGTTFALVAPSPHGAFILATSRDSWRTWQPLTLPVVKRAADFRVKLPNQSAATQAPSLPHQLWVNPDGQHLLYFNPLPDGQTFLFSTSADGGHTWQSLQFPYSSLYLSISIQSPVSGQPWFICENAPDASNVNDAGLHCSRDGGQHWALLPPLDFMSALVGITASGDVLVTTQENPATPNLWRLTPGATQWQSLGGLPDSTPLYVTAPRPGVLWAQNSGASATFPAAGWYQAPYTPH